MSAPEILDIRGRDITGLAPGDGGIEVLETPAVDVKILVRVFSRGVGLQVAREFLVHLP